MTDEEIGIYMKTIGDSLVKRDDMSLTALAVEMLVRIAAAQEAIVHFANLDLEAQIKEAVESRAEERAAEMQADKTRRSFIGKKQST